MTQRPHHLLLLLLLLSPAASQSSCSCAVKPFNPEEVCMSPTGNIAASSNPLCSATPCATVYECSPTGGTTCDVATAQATIFDPVDPVATEGEFECANSTRDVTRVTPEPVIVTRQCCFSGADDFVSTCSLAPPVPGVFSVSYDYNVEGTGVFEFSIFNLVQVLFSMTVNSVSTNGPAFMQSVVGSTSQLILLPLSLRVEIGTSFAETVGPLGPGNPRFDWLATNPSFSFRLSSFLSENLGGAATSSTLEGCFNFNFTAPSA